MIELTFDERKFNDSLYVQTLLKRVPAYLDKYLVPPLETDEKKQILIMGKLNINLLKYDEKTIKYCNFS